MLGHLSLNGNKVSLGCHLSKIEQHATKYQNVKPHDILHCETHGILHFLPKLFSCPALITIMGKKYTSPDENIILHLQLREKYNFTFAT